MTGCSRAWLDAGPRQAPQPQPMAPPRATRRRRRRQATCRRTQRRPARWCRRASGPRRQIEGMPCPLYVTSGLPSERPVVARLEAPALVPTVGLPAVRSGGLGRARAEARALRARVFLEQAQRPAVRVDEAVSEAAARDADRRGTAAHATAARRCSAERQSPRVAALPGA